MIETRRAAVTAGKVSRRYANIRRVYLLYDLHQLWATGRVAALGGNPYDTEQINQQLMLLQLPYLEKSGGTFYPPWAFWLLAGIGSFPFAAVKWVWAICSIGAAIFCLHTLFALASDRYEAKFKLSPPLLVFIVISFLPLMKVLLWGQPVLVELVGLVLFLRLYSNSGSTVGAGLALSLALVKPQLIIPLLAFLTVRAFRTRDARIVVGLVAGFALQGLVSLQLYPNGFPDFAARLRQLGGGDAPMLIQATAGHLAFLLSGSTLLITASPLIAGVIGACAALRRRPSLWRDLGMLLAAGVCITPYAWSHDQVLLLLPFITFVFASPLSRAATCVVVAAQCVVSWLILAGLGVQGEPLLVWLPLALGILWFVYPPPRTTHRARNLVFRFAPHQAN